MEPNDIRTVKYSMSQQGYKKVAEVYETTDYELFTTFKSNREPDHVGRIISNILDKGYVSNPIQVTPDAVSGKLIIIDGNNRKHALQELGLPISFVILEDATETDMVALNLVSKNWQKKNYIDFYASRNIQSYITFRKFLNDYPDFKVATMEYVLKLSCENDHSMEKSHGNHHKLERGNFQVKDEDRSRAILKFCMDVKEIDSNDVVYNQNYFVLAVMRLFRLPVFEPDDMLYKMKTYKTMIKRQLDIKSYAMMMEEIYNKNRRGERIHFDI